MGVRSRIEGRRRRLLPAKTQVDDLVRRLQGVVKNAQTGYGYCLAVVVGDASRCPKYGKVAGRCARPGRSPDASLVAPTTGLEPMPDLERTGWCRRHVHPKCGRKA